MKLREIIDILEGGTQAVLYEKMYPYKNLLRAHFTESFGSAPILIHVAVFNAAQYCIIAPQGEVYDAIVQYDKEAANDEGLMEQYTQYLNIL